MLNAKILLNISGSIAAYKIGYLISKFVKSGCEVQAVVTENVLQFIGKATLEGLTGKDVFIDSFEPGKMLSNIELTKWADIAITAPATANIINKFASGVADDLVSSLFLAYDLKKPFLVVPAMNTFMLKHPATQESLKKLTSWGVKVLPTQKGRLACGDEGDGKMIEPDEISDFAVSEILKNKIG